MNTSRNLVNRERVAWYGALTGLSLLAIGLYKNIEAGSPEQPQDTPSRVLQLEPEELSYMNPEEEQSFVYIPDRTHLSPNYTEGRNGQQIDTIVIHTTEGSGIGAEEWLNNPMPMQVPIT